MKKNILLIAFLFYTTLSFCQTQNKSLTGMYASSNNNDWISIKDNGTGKFCINSDFMPLGCKLFTWESNKDQIIFHYKDEMGYDEQKWCYWSNKNGTINLDFPTFTNYLNFTKNK